MDRLPILQDTLYVVETETKLYLGRIEDCYEYIVVRTGLSGRPAVIAYEDIEQIFLARLHPDVEFLIENEKLMDLLWEVEPPQFNEIYQLRPPVVNQ